MALTPFAVVPLPLGTIATGNEIASNPAAHLAEHAYTGLTWKTSSNTNVWVRGDFGSAQDIDFMAIVSANALAGTKFRLRLGDTQGEVDGTADYDSGAGGQTFINPAITRKDGLYHAHWELPSVQSERWWRLDITGHTGAFEAASLILGKKLTVAKYYEPDWEAGVVDTGSVELNELGVPQISMGKIMRSISFRLRWMTEAEHELTWGPFDEQVGRTGIAYWCFDPDATVYRQRRTYMGWNRENPFARKRKGGWMEKTIEVYSVI